MVKRRTKYITSIIEPRDLASSRHLEATMISANTLIGLSKKIRSFPVDWTIDSYFRFTKLIKSNRRVKLHGARIDRMADIENLRYCKSIRAMWHEWDRSIGSIIPDGFRVLVNKYEAMPTALSIKKRLRSLIPTSYNCYLLDRDFRRYLGLELRHD